MAYATEAEVLAELGLSAATNDYTAALIAKAIVRSDRQIDRWDPDTNADNNDKIDASNAFAAGLMIEWVNVKKLRGRTQGGTANQPSQVTDPSQAKLKFDKAREIMAPYMRSTFVTNVLDYTSDSDNLFE